MLPVVLAEIEKTYRTLSFAFQLQNSPEPNVIITPSITAYSVAQTGTPFSDTSAVSSVFLGLGFTWFTLLRIGQSTPYPQALNTLTVTIKLSHILSYDARAQINITGLVDFSRPTGVYFLGRGSRNVSGPEYFCGGILSSNQTSAASNTSVAAAAATGTAYWDNNMKVLALPLVRDLPRLEDIVISFQLFNGIFKDRVQNPPGIGALAIATGNSNGEAAMLLLLEQNKVQSKLIFDFAPTDIMV